MAKSKRGNNSISRGVGWSYEEQCARVNKKLLSMKKKDARKQKEGTNSTTNHTNNNTTTNQGLDREELVPLVSSSSSSSSRGYKRTSLAHDTQDQRDTKKLLLHLSHLQREIEKLRHNLSHWDEEEEQKEKERNRQERQEQPKLPLTRAEKAARKRQKMDPSNWKLRGAARPAWEVYDFDTRYVCPHVQSQEREKERRVRLQNLLVIYRGQFGSNTDDLPIECRTFLSLLMQYGTLCIEAQRFQSARTAFLECIDLEGNDTSITNAKCRLLRMCLDQNRIESARTYLTELITPHDQSAWIRYGAALVQYITWKETEQGGCVEPIITPSNTTTAAAAAAAATTIAQQTLRQAFEANIFVAYYLAFHTTFNTIMEYTEDVEDAEAGTVEEAIEYCSSEQMNVWFKTDGAIQWVRTRLLQERKHTTNDRLNWEKRLQEAELSLQRNEQSSMEEDATTTTTTTSSSCNEALRNVQLPWTSTELTSSTSKTTTTTATDDDCSNSDNQYTIDSEDKVDIKMYFNMFRTAMEVIEDSGMLV
jgi:hypothetical protein